MSGLGSVAEEKLLKGRIRGRRNDTITSKRTWTRDHEERGDREIEIAEAIERLSGKKRKRDED